MARPMKPLVRGGGYYPSRKWTPLVYSGGYTTMHDEGEQPVPILKTVTGNPIHILDALAKPAQALSAKLEPIQDLHGYDNPWPAGGGKNLLENKLSTVTNNGVTFTVNADGSMILNGTASAVAQRHINPSLALKAGQYVLNGMATGGSSSTRMLYASDGSTIIARDTGGGATFTLNEDTTISVLCWVNNGQTVTNVAVKPMIRLASETDATFSPYSNICPISGHTSADVTRTGKNLLPNISGARSEGSFYIGQADGTTYPTHLEAGVTYAISFTTNLSQAFAYMRENGGSNILFGISGSTYTPATDMDVQMWVYNSGLTSVSDFQLEIGSTATSYSAFVGTTYPIPLGQTVYGGTLDVTTGKLTVDRAMLGNVTWSKRNSYSHMFYATSETGQLVNSTTGVSNVCVLYSGGNLASFASDSEYRFRIGDRIYINIPSVSNVTDLNAWITNNSLQICYELATPITIQLTPQQVELLLGENNLFSDGEMTLVYLADGNASDIEALNILLGGRYVNNHGEDEPTDREALNIILGGNER